jgi:hypothetical protein
MNCNENLPHFNNQSPSQSTISTHQNIHPSPLVPRLSSHERVATTPMMGSPSLHDSCGEIDPLMPVGQHLWMPSSPSISINLHQSPSINQRRHRSSSILMVGASGDLTPTKPSTLRSKMSGHRNTDDFSTRFDLVGKGQLFSQKKSD